MLRFSLSPTDDMHIGDLRIALFNYIIAQQREEEFIVRIDERDKEKNIEGKDQEILALLELFNIQYSQVIYQSQNIRFHSAMALQLLHEKKAFNCFCSSDWLEKKRQEAKREERAYRYDDACRNLPAELVIDNTNPFSIRVIRPDRALIIHDKIKGDVRFELDAFDSFVIMHQDKTPTDDFASAIDDMLHDISMVICSDDYINHTPKQVHIRNALNYDKKIEYAHLPAILNDESLSVKALLEDGYLPQAIVNYLILMGNSHTPKEIFTLKEAIEWFDITKISDSPTRFDLHLLKEINKEHLKNLDAKELSRYVGFADAEIGELARIYLNEASTTKELKRKIAPIFSERTIPQELEDDLLLMAETIKKAPYFEEYEDFKDFILKESGLKEENFLKSLRTLLTNAEDAPDVSLLYKYLKNYIGEIIK